jgi:hypothetical protein
VNDALMRREAVRIGGPAPQLPLSCSDATLSSLTNGEQLFAAPSLPMQSVFILKANSFPDNMLRILVLSSVLPGFVLPR